MVSFESTSPPKFSPKRFTVVEPNVGVVHVSLPPTPSAQAPLVTEPHFVGGVTPRRS